MSGLTAEGLRRSVRSYSQPRVGGGSGNSSRSAGTNYGRVIKTVLNQSDVSETAWKALGFSQALYGVYYQRLFDTSNTVELVSDSDSIYFAYCYQSSFRRIPIKNEIVTLETTIAGDLSEEMGSTPVYRTYWKDIIPIWNHPSLNQYPDILRNGESHADTGEYYIEDNKVNPLQLCPGDLTIEGRYGNTVRFGGTRYKGSVLPTEEINGQPYIILRNGQGVDNKGKADDPIYEDINLDSGSIYMTAGQKVPLEQANIKYSALSKRPVLANEYTGSQIVQTSDRVFLNGRDDVQIASTNAFGVTSDNVHLDGNKEVSVDAEKILIGQSARSLSEPCLKGTTTIEMLANMIEELTGLIDTITTADSDPGIFIGALKSSAAIHKEFLNNYKGQLKKLLSTKVFVE